MFARKGRAERNRGFGYFNPNVTRRLLSGRFFIQALKISATSRAALSLKTEVGSRMFGTDVQSVLRRM
jgi:hypothetical protein